MKKYLAVMITMAGLALGWSSASWAQGTSTTGSAGTSTSSGEHHHHHKNADTSQGSK
jgi:hypothetical protein